MAIYTLTATAGNDNKTIYEPTGGTWVYTWDGLAGTDTLSFDRLPQSDFDIYMDIDGRIHVDSTSGASHFVYATLTNVEKLSFNEGSDIVNLATLFDTTAPTISSLSPTDEATGVQLSANLVITFNESVKKGSGNIVLKESNGTVVATYSAATSSNLSFSGSALTINPTNNLVAGKTYVLEIASGAVTDLAGNAFTGISTYNFSTVAANSAPTGTPVITGTPTQGNTLTASNTLADADGMGTVSYQWQANGADIGGASGSTLVLGQSLVGKVITLKASYTDGAGKSETVTSSATTSVANVNDSPTGNVSVNGSLVQGSTLTASNTLTDADGMGTVSYQWQADGADIGGATGSTLVLGQSLVGKSIRVKASYTDGGGQAESVTSTASAAVTNVNDAPAGSVSVNGSPVEGRTLTASNTLTDADGMGTVSYQWQADGADIGGATGSTLVLGQSLVGKSIRVKASYTDGGGQAESVTSTASAAVTNVNDAPAGSVSVNGSLVQGSTLTASNTLTDADGMGTVSYQWQADGADIGGATGSTLVLGQSLVGKSIRVKASYTDGAGQSETVLSESTASVLNVNDAPLLNQALTDQSFHSTQSFNLTFPVNQFADADGDNLSMTVKLSNGYDLPTWLVLNPATRTLSALAGTALVGRYELRVTVSDGQYTATDEFFIDVTEPVDLVAPIVVDVEPVNQANGIQIDASIVVQFDEPIRVSDLANDFVLRNVATSELIDLTISVSGYAVTLDPVGLLQANTTYEVVLKSGSVQDFSGNEFTGMQGWQFTTASDGQTMQGSANADQFHSSQGNDTIQGGLGIDTVEYSGQAESYQITSHRVGSDTELSTMTVHDGVTGRDGIDQLSGIEKLVFADKTLNLMVKAQSLQISESAMNRIAELYVAFFNRVPDGDGMSYWMGEYKNGKTINQIADSFYNAGVYFSELTGYRADMTDSDFIHTVYRNVLGRPDGADEGGLAHWTAELSSGRATKGTLVSAILDAAHGVTFSDPANAYHWVQTLLDNKLDLAKQVAIEWGLNYNTSEDSITQGKAIAAAVTSTGYEQAIELVGLHWQEAGSPQ